MLLIGLGLGGYFGTGTSNLRALIPAAFGVVLTGLGMTARVAEKRKLAMQAAGVWAALGYVVLIHHGSPGTAALISQSVVVMLTVFYFVFAVKSFRDARKARKRSA